MAAARHGKTRAITEAVLGARLESVVIIDTQRQDFTGPAWATWPRGESPEPIWTAPRYIWQPPIWSISARVDGGPWTRGLQLLEAGRLADPAHPARGVTVVVDQGADCLKPGLHPLLQVLVRQGMARGCGLWVGTQGPYEVDPQVRKSALHRFAGRVASAQDRGILAADWQCEPLNRVLEHPPPYGWYAIPLGAAEPIGPLDFVRLRVRPGARTTRAAGSDPTAPSVAREPQEIGAPPGPADISRTGDAAVAGGAGAAV